MAVSMS